LSDEPLDRFLGKLDKLTAKLRELGWKHESPSVLEFLGACGDTPHMKITDVGLLDIGKRQIVDVVVT
jgi:adenine deaminase